MNLYGYAGGDPINYSDPFGLCPGCDLAVAAMRWAMRHPRAAAAAVEFASNVQQGAAVVSSPAGGTCDGPGCSTGALIGLAGIALPTARLGAATRAGTAAMVRPGGNMARLLPAIEEQAALLGPRTAHEALTVLDNATKSVGLEVGLATRLENGGYTIASRGGVTTNVGSNGSITINRGDKVLLDIQPKAP